jgi:hypothetical protein
MRAGYTSELKIYVIPKRGLDGTKRAPKAEFNADGRLAHPSVRQTTIPLGMETTKDLR